jgi:hypothetical protein
MLFSFYKKLLKSSQIYMDLHGQVKCEEAFTFTHTHPKLYTFTLTQSVKEFATYTCTLGMSKTYAHRTLVGTRYHLKP